MGLEHVEDIYRLSPTQQGMLAHAVSNPNTEAYMVQISFAFEGDLNTAWLRQAWEQVLSRYDALRTSFHWEEVAEPVQVVLRSVALPWHQEDWRHLSTGEQQERLAAYLATDRRRGFDLSEAPLMRLTLIQTGERTFHFVWTQHHLLMDGWSLSLVLREVLTTYEGAASGRQQPLSPVRPYGDFIAWLQEQDVAGAEAFWREHLGGITGPTTLRVQPPAPLPAEPITADLQVELDPATLANLHAFGRRHGLTLNTLVQGAWTLLLSRYSGEPDVVFGSTTAGRPAELSGVEAMVGLFINTLPVRVTVPADGRLVDWLKELQARQARMRQYEWSPLAQVQAWSEVPRGTPLFESILVFQNYPSGGALPEGVSQRFQLKDVRGVVRTNFPLTLVAEPGVGLTLRLEYSTMRYSDQTAARILGHLKMLLQSFPDWAEEPAATVPMLTEAERHQLLVAWNETAAPFPADRTAHQLITEQAERSPEAIALRFGTTSLTYGELNRRANQVAHRLRALGVGPDVLVGLYMERAPETVIGLLGILKAGGAYVPLDPAYPVERIAFMLEDSQPGVLLIQERLRASLPPTKAAVYALDGDWAVFAAESAANPVDGAGPENLAYVIYTSGSTGRPKGAMIEHRGLVNYLTWAARAYRVGEGEGSPVHSSFSFDLTVTSLFLPLLTGRTVTLVPPDQRIEGLTEALLNHGDFSLVKLTPAHLEILNRSVPASEAAGRTAAFIIGGEQLLGETLAFWQANAPETRLINEYGPTETVVGCVVYETPYGEEISGAVPIGRPIANTQLYLLDQFRQPVPVGLPGELYIGGAGVARGYLNRPDLTAERFIANPFGEGRLYRTGDLVRYRQDGVLEYMGRLDDQVKIHGYRIELGEIEQTLSQYPGLRECAVLVREDEPGARRLVAYHVAPGGVSVDDLRHFLAAHLPDYMVPTAFVAMDRLPLTTNGKVDRRALPAPEQPAPEAGSLAAPRNEVERILAKAWIDVLGVEQIGIHDNFFERGGDSILGIQMIASVNQQGFKLKPNWLFERPTIALLAELVGEGQTGPVTGAESEGPFPLSPVQSWFFEQEPPEPHHFNQSLLLEVRQPLHTPHLAEALRAVVAHHGALRLRFTRSGGFWQQEYGPAPMAVPITEIDLGALPPADRAGTLTAEATKIQASLSLSDGLLLRVVLFRMGAGAPDRLLMVIHHLAVDGVSWRVLLDDLQSAYQQVQRGEAVALPSKTTSFGDWVKRLQTYAQDPAAQAELGHWLTTLQGGGARLPLDYPDGTNTEAESRTVKVAMTTAETRNLLQSAQNRINEVLLAALARAFARTMGAQSLLVDVEGHGREDLFEEVDHSRTVGWFTSIFPVLLDLRNAKSPSGALKVIRDQVRAIPNRGIGYGVLRYALKHPALQALPQAQVSFNYLGQFDQVLAATDAFGVAAESAGATRSPLGRRSHVLGVDGHVMNGQLEVWFSFSAGLHRPATIELLADAFVTELRELIEVGLRAEEGAEFSTSDFPLAEVEQDELDLIMARLKGKG